MAYPKHKYARWMVGLLLAGLLSCTERVDIELDSTYRRLVVYGTVTTDSVRHRVDLSTTSDYFLNAASPVVSGAIVELVFDDTSLLFQEQDSLKGTYLAPYAFRGRVGTTYHLNISQVDVDGNGEYESYHAWSTMPGGVRMDSISLNYNRSFWWSGWEVYMFALDPPTVDWYGLKIWKNSDLLTDTLIKYQVVPDDFYNGKYLYYGFPIAFLSDSSEREKVEPGDTVTLELNSIDQAYYNFIIDAQLEIFGNNPLFSGPPANVRSNIDNGGKGIFTAYSVERASAVARQLEP
jgi:hypothetical protein